MPLTIEGLILFFVALISGLMLGAFFRPSKPAKVYWMFRRQVLQDFVDAAFEYIPGESLIETKSRFQKFYDQIGVLYEVVKAGAEAENEKKRQAAKEKAKK